MPTLTFCIPDAAYTDGAFNVYCHGSSIRYARKVFSANAVVAWRIIFQVHRRAPEFITSFVYCRRAKGRIPVVVTQRIIGLTLK